MQLLIVDQQLNSKLNSVLNRLKYLPVSCQKVSTPLHRGRHWGCLLRRRSPMLGAQRNYDPKLIC